MTIQEFKQELTKRASRIGPGANWRRADFHVHFPMSRDYEYKAPDSFERLARELSRQRLSFAVVLKHEQFPTRDELDKLQELCPDVTLIPGAEINIIVDALFKKIGKDYFFHCIVAVDPREKGDYSYVLRSAIENYQYRDGDYPAGFRSSVLDVGLHFREKGALFILRQRQTAAFFDGKQVTLENRAIPKATCVCSSDAHHHDHIAQRHRATWIRAERPTSAELRAALSLPHRVAIDAPSSDYSRVVGLHVSGAFINECWLNFNESLNATYRQQGKRQDRTTRVSSFRAEHLCTARTCRVCV
ncbi:MAG: hypothetical protein DMG93_19810 [Acidobacteria bacterium]|nr:MAG: hypothetical protein DMG93_19810 [Acidobacteriota bacterium]